MNKKINIAPRKASDPDDQTRKSDRVRNINRKKNKASRVTRRVNKLRMR